jgi:integrase
LPARQRGGLADPGNDIPRIAAPTVERHLISIKAFLTFCLEQEWVQFNAATGLRVARDDRPKAARRRPFSRAELTQLVARAELEYGTEGDMTWLIKLAAYTGARLEELAQLSRANIRELDGVWVVEFDDLDGRHLKNFSSVKVVPLHRAIREPFTAFVSKNSGQRVFSSFKPDKDGRFANKISSDFARLMDRAGLPDPRLVFHSLRHTLKREMSNARVDPDMRREIIGHAPRSAHDSYAGASLPALEQELNKVTPLF